MFGKKKKVAPYTPPVFDCDQWYNPQHTCPDCGESFVYESSLSVHRACEHSKPLPFLQTCIVCSFRDTPEALLEHLKIHQTKEDTMNTYIVTTEGMHHHKIQGTTHTVNGGGLWIQDGVKAVAFFKHYDRFTIERDVDRGYVNKINELESELEDEKSTIKRLLQTIERNSTTIAELRKQRDEHKMKLNNLYGVGKCSSRYINASTLEHTFSCELKHGHLGAHHDPVGVDWTQVYEDTDSLHNKCVERTEIKWDGEPLVITCALERGHKCDHSAAQVGYRW